MSLYNWFCEQMNNHQLITRGFIEHKGLGEYKAVMELWTSYMGDEPIWGGLRYSYHYWHSGHTHHDMTIYPLMKPQEECARESTAQWSHVGWKQRKLVVVMYNPGTKDFGGYDTPLGNPWVLQHLARIDGILPMIRGGEASTLAFTLRHRLDGLLSKGNTELADRTRPLM